MEKSLRQVASARIEDTNKRTVIIVSPSLDATQNVSGISAVAQFIISNNAECDYVHFELGRKDKERKGWFRLFSLAKSYSKWRRLMRQEHGAVVHYNFPLSKASIIRDPLFMYEALKCGYPMLVHIHGGVFLTHYDSAPWFIRWILRKVFAWKVPFVVLGDNEKRILENGFGAGRVALLPNCVDLTDAVAYRRTADGEKPLVLGYIGRIAETKGMEYLLQACVQLKRRGVPFVMKLAGAEEVKDYFLPLFDSYLGGRFVYSGVVSGEKKNEFLRSLDVFVLPSFFEGLPMSLLECMSYGAVPVTTDVGSIGEVVEDGKNGLIIKDHDTESIVKAVAQLDADRNLLEQLGRMARETIFEKFNPQKYIRELNRLYDECS